MQMIKYAQRVVNHVILVVHSCRKEKRWNYNFMKQKFKVFNIYNFNGSPFLTARALIKTWL